MSRRFALLAAVGAGLAAGAGVGLLGERRVVRAPRLGPDSLARQLAAGGQPPDRRSREVLSADGVRLHVEESGSPSAPVTVLFVHGWTMTTECWRFQVAELAGDDIRVVAYDHRGHGRSGRPDLDRCEIEDLGADLYTVVQQVCPDGPVVLVGHSMGGMTVMALADAHPELFTAGGAVVAVCLMSTSAGRLAELTVGLPAIAGRALRVVAPRQWRLLMHVGDRLESRRPRGNDIAYALTRRISFGGPVPPSLVDLMQRMVDQCPLPVVGACAGALLRHDKLAALRALREVPVLVLVGSADVLTPVDHAEAIAAELPDAELVTVPGAGHMVMLERPELTTLHLRALLRRAVPAAVR